MALGTPGSSPLSSFPSSDSSEVEDTGDEIDVSPESPFIPVFKQVTRYSEGDNRVCFVNFDKFPGQSIPVRRPEEQYVTPYGERLRNRFLEQALKLPAKLPADLPEEISLKLPIKQSAKLSTRSSKNTAAKLAGTAKGPRVPPEMISVFSSKNLLKKRSANFTTATTSDPQTEGYLDESEEELGSHKSKNQKTGLIPTVGRRIRYNKEQEAWLLDHIVKFTPKGANMNWIVCSAQFRAMFNQDRKPFSLYMKWKDLTKNDDNGSSQAKAVGEDVEGGEEERKIGPDPNNKNNSDKEQIEDIEKTNGGDEGMVKGEHKGDKKQMGDIEDASGGDEEMVKEEHERDEGEAEVEELEQVKTAHEEMEEKNGDDTEGEDKEKGEATPNDDNDNDSDKSAKVSPPVPFRYSPEENTWIIAYVAEQSKTSRRRDWIAASIAHKKIFGFRRSSNMLCQKWKDIKSREKKMAQSSASPPLKKRKSS